MTSKEQKNKLLDIFFDLLLGRSVEGSEFRADWHRCTLVSAKDLFSDDQNLFTPKKELPEAETKFHKEGRIAITEMRLFSTEERGAPSKMAHNKLHPDLERLVKSAREPYLLKTKMFDNSYVLIAPAGYVLKIESNELIGARFAYDLNSGRKYEVHFFRVSDARDKNVADSLISSAESDNGIDGNVKTWLTFTFLNEEKVKVVGFVTESARFFHWSLYDRDQFNVGSMRSIAKQLFTTLARYQELNFVHGSIEPKNIALIQEDAKRTKRDVVKLRNVNSLYSQFSFSKDYLSPELTAGGGIGRNHKSDVWAVGLSILELCTRIFNDCLNYRIDRPDVLLNFDLADYHESAFDGAVLNVADFDPLLANVLRRILTEKDEDRPSATMIMAFIKKVEEDLPPVVKQPDSSKKTFSDVAKQKRGFSVMPAS